MGANCWALGSASVSPGSSSVGSANSRSMMRPSFSSSSSGVGVGLKSALLAHREARNTLAHSW
jgi:hypothetical protein